MIQRIQTVFILIAWVLIASTLVLPWVEIVSPEGDLYNLKSFGIESSGGELGSELKIWPIGLLASIIAALSFLSIFLYKKRLWQSRITTYNMVLSLLLPVQVYFYISVVRDNIPGDLVYQIICIFPLVAAVLFFLARRRIIADHLLVSSFDRIR